MMYGKIIKLPTDEFYFFTFVTESGILKYNAVIKEYVYLEDFNFMIVQLQSEIEKVQRREFLRFDCVIPLKFAELPQFLSDDENLQSFLEGTAMDLSEGGIRFLSNENIDVGQKLRFIITLNYDFVTVLGNILHKQEYPKSNFKYQYRAQFFDLQKEDKDKIINYIFFEQRFKARKDRENLFEEVSDYDY